MAVTPDLQRRDNQGAGGDESLNTLGGRLRFFMPGVVEERGTSPLGQDWLKQLQLD